uniref:Uncharacterized protein n=1 Tax=Rhizophora mucronata TaxID=61149 RepID=A0A2P2K2B9_RHIMU
MNTFLNFELILYDLLLEQLCFMMYVAFVYACLVFMHILLHNNLLDSNRAAAFLQLVKLNKALADAETTITLNPKWEKVWNFTYFFFLFGKILLNLNMFFLTHIDAPPGIFQEGFCARGHGTVR